MHEQSLILTQNRALTSIDVVETTVLVLHHMDELMDQNRPGADVCCRLQRNIQIDYVRGVIEAEYRTFVLAG